MERTEETRETTEVERETTEVEPETTDERKKRERDQPEENGGTDNPSNPEKK